jgi:Arc/MetJ-type ribon-helix-helix transcriptional regulator
MPLSVRLSPEEEAMLEAASQLTARSRSELVRQGVRELCQRLNRAPVSAADLGADLFDLGGLALEPDDSAKRAVYEQLAAKHGRAG